MSINPRCLAKIRIIMINNKVCDLNVELIHRRNLITKAIIHYDGTVTAAINGVTYACPSAMRNDLIASNLQTYPKIFFNGVSLRQLGVHR